MTVTIEVTPDDEQELARRAASRGLDVPMYICHLIRQDLGSSPQPNLAGLDLLAQWDNEDQTNDPAEIERRRRVWEEFKRSMNENSLSGRMVYL
jgi:hypothetical protein